MPKKYLEVNFPRLQLIINEHEPTWETGQTTFISHVTDLYNLSASENEDKISIGTTVNRWKAGKIKINVKKGRPGGEFGPEHKKALVEGNKGRKRSKTQFNKVGREEILKRKGMPGWSKAVMKRAIENPTLRNRINAKCTECVCFWDRKDIKLCTINSCPLWDVRPFQTSKIKDLLA